MRNSALTLKSFCHKPKKVLFIDDDTELQSLLTVVLEDEDFDLIGLVNIVEVADIANYNPDLILLDEWLLDKKGSDICLELKSEPKTVDIPVILVSAVNGIEKIAARCKADAFISKPFDINYIIKVINSFLLTGLPNHPYSG